MKMYIQKTIPLFTDIFYNYCNYSVYFSVLRYFNFSLKEFFCDTVFHYDYAENANSLFKYLANGDSVKGIPGIMDVLKVNRQWQEPVGDIVNYLKKRLDNGSLLIVLIDVHPSTIKWLRHFEYPDRGFEKVHGPHSLGICGYNEDNRTFTTIDDGGEGAFQDVMSFDELSACHQSLLENCRHEGTSVLEFFSDQRNGNFASLSDAAYARKLVLLYKDHLQELYQNLELLKNMQSDLISICEAKELPTWDQYCILYYLQEIYWKMNSRSYSFQQLIPPKTELCFSLKSISEKWLITKNIAHKDFIKGRVSTPCIQKIISSADEIYKMEKIFLDCLERIEL